MAVRVVVAGLGPRGRDWLDAVRTDLRYELVGCADPDTERLEEVGSALQVPAAHRYLTLDEALDCARPDAVVVATSIDQHVSPVEAALQRGVAVLVEKPFTLGLADAERLVALAAQSSVPLIVAQNYRYLRVHRTVKRVLERETLGRLGMVVTQYYRPGDTAPTAGGRVPHWLLWQVAVHHLDAMRYVLGREALGVMARGFDLPWADVGHGTACHILLEFDGEIQATYCGAYHTHGHEFFERGQEFYQRFVGERGALHVFHRWIVVCLRGKLPYVVRRGRRTSSEEHALLGQLERAVHGGEEPECSGRDNLQTMAILEACVRSAQEARWVSPRALLAPAT